MPKNRPAPRAASAVALGLIGTGVVLGGLYALYAAGAPRYRGMVCAHRADREDEHIVGVGVCLTTDYITKGGERVLTAFFIYELVKGEGHVWGLPHGGRTARTDGSPARKASEELDEELHVPIKESRIGDPTHFCRVDVRSGRSSHMALYVSRRPGEGNCSELTRDEFAKRKAADWHKGYAFREAEKMTHVPIQSMLSAKDGVCLDIYGNELKLRRLLFDKLLPDANFRETLQRALDSYNEYTRSKARP